MQQLSPHFSHFEAFGETLPSPSVERRARQLARQMEFLRARTGSRPLVVQSWTPAASKSQHPAGEGHVDGGAVDIVPPVRMPLETFATVAHDLGFYRVTKLSTGALHVEIAPEGASVEQLPLTTVARSGAPERGHRAGTGIVHDATPEARYAALTGVPGRYLFFELEGVPTIVARRLVTLAAAITEGARASGLDRAFLAGITIQEGAGRHDAYRSEGPHWWRRNIAEKGYERSHPDVVDLHDPDQWGSAGAWQMLRSTAIGLGFPASTRWATRLRLTPTKEIDQPTGLPRGAKSGSFEGPFADVALAASYTGRYLAQLAEGFDGDRAKTAAAYNAGAGNVRRAVARAGDAWLDVLPEIAANDAPRTYAPRVLAWAATTERAFAALDRIGV